RSLQASFAAVRILYRSGETTPDVTVFFSNGFRLLPWGLGGRPQRGVNGLPLAYLAIRKIKYSGFKKTNDKPDCVEL
ncbi:MAG: hypothetical protein VZS12_11395, partial [Ruminococcus bromii]|nr:hypothetical protein [Ruminococcus bromii]